MDPPFQPATPADLEVLLAMVRELYAFNRIPFNEPVARGALSELLHEPMYGCVWLITDRVGLSATSFGINLLDVGLG